MQTCDNCRHSEDVGQPHYTYCNEIHDYIEKGTPICDRFKKRRNKTEN